MKLVNKDKFLKVQFLDDQENKQYLDALVFWERAEVGDLVIIANNQQRFAGKLIRGIESGDNLSVTINSDGSLQDIPIVTVDGSPWKGFAIQKST